MLNLLLTLVAAVALPVSGPDDHGLPWIPDAVGLAAPPEARNPTGVSMTDPLHGCQPCGTYLKVEHRSNPDSAWTTLGEFNNPGQTGILPIPGTSLSLDVELPTILPSGYGICYPIVLGTLPLCDPAEGYGCQPIYSIEMEQPDHYFKRDGVLTGRIQNPSGMQMRECGLTASEIWGFRYSPPIGELIYPDQLRITYGCTMCEVKFPVIGD